jgi:hypothetical protein
MLIQYTCNKHNPHTKVLAPLVTKLCMVVSLQLKVGIVRLKVAIVFQTAGRKDDGF